MRLGSIVIENSPIMNLESLLKYLTGPNAYVAQVFIVILITLTVDLVQKKMVQGLMAKAKNTKNPWDTASLKAMGPPLRVIIWAVGLFMATQIIEKATESTLFSSADSIRDAIIIIALTWFLVRFIKNSETIFLEKDQDQTTVDAVSKLLRLSVVITGFLVGLQTLGFSISGILAFGGVGGIAVGFAARDLLANFFGGLMIYMDRPFAVGDWVRSPDREIEGTIEHIGWRLTRIRTFDKRPLYVPNSVFNTISLENPQRMLNRRIKETIGIRYDDASKMQTIIQKVKEMLQNHPEIDTDRTLIVNFDKFAASSLEFFIYTFTKTTNWVHFHEVKQDVLLKIIDIVEGEGAEFAFPTSTLHIRTDVPNPDEMVPPENSEKP